jgi:vesicular inhibitory amino acid transporter
MEGEGDKWQQKCDEDVALNIPLIGAEHEGSSGPNNNVTTSFLKTCFNGLNALSGVGILSVPYALASGGWLSLALLFFIAAVAFYSGILMKRCMEKIPT